jgi:hypothetical protein
VSKLFNISTRRIGGIRFVKIGRLTMSYCVSRAYKPVRQPTIPNRGA